MDGLWSGIVSSLHRNPEAFIGVFGQVKRSLFGVGLNIDSLGGLGYIDIRWYIFTPPFTKCQLRINDMDYRYAQTGTYSRNRQLSS